MSRSEVKVFPLHDLRLLFYCDLLRILPGWAYVLPDPLPLEDKINVPIFSALIDRYSNQLLL